jgi:hypothetical protein
LQQRLVNKPNRTFLVKETGEKISSENQESKEPARFDSQIKRVRELINGWGDDVRVYNAPFVDEEGRRAFMRRFALGPRRGGKASIVPADECAAELGAPGKTNVNMVLWTDDISLVRDGKISLVGPDIKAGEKASYPYAQVIMLAVNHINEIDPFTLESTQYLSNRLPGFMVRTVPGRLWVRISHDAVKQGLDFARLGGALIAAYRDDFTSVKAAEVLFVTLDDGHVQALEPTAAEAKIILGKNKKLVLVGDGTYECTDLDCDNCDEKEICDEVKDIVILRRKRKQSVEK